MTQEVKLKRAICSYQAEDARFLLECEFSERYPNYHHKKLENVRHTLEVNCRSKWDHRIPIYCLSQLASIFETNYDQILSPSPASNSSISSNRSLARYIKKHSTPQLHSPIPEDSAVDKFPIVSTPDVIRQPRGSRSSLSSPGLDQLRSPIVSNVSVNGEDLIENKFVHIESDDKSQKNEDHKVELFNKDQCIIIGTLFKRMRLEPDTLEELCQGEFNIKCEHYLGHYLSQDDKLILEDLEETISLTGDIDASKLVTGINLALLGQPIDSCCKFLVRDICFAEPNRQLLYEVPGNNSLLSTTLVPQSADINTTDNRPLYLLAISGLEFMQDMDKQSMMTAALQNVINFIWGGGKFVNDERSSRVVRVLILGNNLSNDRLYNNRDSNMSTVDVDPATKLKQSRQIKPYTSSIKAINHLDDFFAQLSKTVNVDVMPGYTDPTPHILPQQPFHPCMFPKSSLLPTFNCVTNPHRAIYDGKVDILAASGQNIDMTAKFSGMSDPIEIMRCHLMWGNIAPNAANMLCTVPYVSEDPMILDFIPEIYLAGCQEYFMTSYYKYEASLPSKKDSTSISTSFNSDAQNTPLSSSDQSRQIRNTKTSEISDSLVEKTIRLEQSPWSPGTNISQAPKSSLGQKIKTMLITVPKFSETLSCVLINLKTLRSELITFS